MLDVGGFNIFRDDVDVRSGNHIGYGSSGDNDGIGTNAEFVSPYPLALDMGGNIYVSDYFAATVRKVTTAGWSCVYFTRGILKDSCLNPR